MRFKPTSKLIFPLLLLLLPFIIQVIRFKNLNLVFSIKHPTPLSPLYSLRSGKEYLQDYFILGDEDLAHWYLILESKRLEEAQLLSQNQVYDLAKQEVVEASVLQEQATKLIIKLKDTTNIDYLTETLSKNQSTLISVVKSLRL